MTGAEDNIIAAIKADEGKPIVGFILFTIVRDDSSPTGLTIDNSRTFSRDADSKAMRSLADAMARGVSADPEELKRH